MSPRNGLPSRRGVLTSLLVLAGSAIAGCFSPQMGGPVDELSVYNATGGQVEVRLAVREIQGDRLAVNETFTLDAERGREYVRPFGEDGRKRLEIVIDGSRRTSYEWEANAEPDGTGVEVTIHEGRIDIDQVSR